MGRLSDLMRNKMEKMESKLTRFSARTQSKIRTQYIDVIKPARLNASGRDEVEHIKSSWIRSFAYDNHTHTLYMTVHTGKTYSWNNIDPDIAWKCIRGDAICRTNDPTHQQRWWIGKDVSLGASYWIYLRNLTPHVTSTAPQYPGANPYYDIINEGYPTMYNVDFTGHKRGRPTKEDQKARDFGWAGRYKKTPTEGANQ